MKSSPLALVKERFTDKAGLVKAVQALATDELWLGRVSEGKGLDSVSNRKLLHLHEVLSEVQKSYGSRSGLIDALLKGGKREKDTGFKTRLEKWPTPRLLDAARSMKKGEKNAAKAAPKAAKSAAPKAATKAAPKAKTASKAKAKA
ncbi:MAG: hypothetical protein J0L92_35155 [Deltaproteobacteria bacterium]|nr:hypothetical protein [Deltaproteobacteria bacterium]